MANSETSRETIIWAMVPIQFFSRLLPVNMEVLGWGTDTSASLRAVAPGEGGKFFRSEEYIIFSSGLGTLVLETMKCDIPPGEGYVLGFRKRWNSSGKFFWSVEAPNAEGDIHSSTPWTLRVFDEEPDDDLGHVIPLVSQRSGLPGYHGQFICLHSPAV